MSLSSENPHPMPAAPPPLNDLLRGVSRSFYLSIRLLPAGLRAPVGLAYLLARAADTLADTATVPAGVRLDLLGRVAAAVASGSPDERLAADAAAFARSVAHADEQQLLLRWPEALSALTALDPHDRDDVRIVLGHIVRGQRLDLERFPGAMPDAAALREYAYLVAGCVGEFWTDICARHVEGYARRPRAEMRELGRSFGAGLQLVNIVRDAGEDMAAGRHYLPADELAAADFQSVWRRWQDEAERGLRDGMAYADAVNSRRIRAAVALPALLGQRTLALLRAAGPRALNDRVKVRRGEVHLLLARMAVTLAGRGALRAEWDNRAR